MFIEIIVIALLCFILVELRTLNKASIRVEKRSEGLSGRMNASIESFKTSAEKIKNAFDPANYEYKLISTHMSDFKKLEESLNNHAQVGWQVVGVSTDIHETKFNHTISSRTISRAINILLKRRKVTSTETPGVFKFGSSNPTPGGGFTFGKT